MKWGKMEDNSSHTISLNHDDAWFRRASLPPQIALCTPRAITRKHKNMIESPTELGPVEITPVPIVGGQYQLETDTTREYKTFKWLDGNGETLSEQNSVRVNPKATGNKYVLLAANEEGDVATGSINLEGNDGIKAVATPTAKSLEVTLKRPAPTGAMVTVTSVVDGGSKVTSGMPEGAEAITLDISGLSNGVYVVSYSINSEQIDQKKVNIN